MGLDIYFSSLAIGVSVGVLVAGITAMATGPKQNRLLFHVGTVMTLLSVSYFAGGMIESIATLRRPILFGVVVLLILASAYFHMWIWLKERRPLELRLKQTDDSLQEARSQLSSEEAKLIEHRSIAIEKVYETLNEQALFDFLIDKIENSDGVTICYNDVQELAAVTDTPLLLYLKELFSRGIEVRLVHCEIRGEMAKNKQLLDKCKLVFVDPATLPTNLFCLAIAHTICFSVVRPEKGLYGSPVFVGTLSAQDSPTSLAKSVSDLLQWLLEVAKSLKQSDKPNVFGKITTCASPFAYQELIVTAERTASEISRIPKRISVLFKGDDLIKHIARNRFGTGNEELADPYVNEHICRREIFFEALNKGQLHCREIYNTNELEKYFGVREHSGNQTISIGHLKEMLERWKNTILTYPENYVVGLTEDPVPFKYQVVDKDLVILHEAVGTTDLYRLNAISFEGRAVADQFHKDFNTIWSKIPKAGRDPESVSKWISDHANSL